LVDHELGSEIEFQCDLDNDGSPTVFLDAIDTLNQSALQVSVGDMKNLRFDVATQFIQSHLDLKRSKKPQELSFGIGGEAVMKKLVSRDVAMAMLEEKPPEDDDEAAENKNGDAAEEAVPGESGMLIEFPLDINQKTILEFTKTQRDAFERMDVKVNLKLSKELGKPVRYQWESFSFVIADTKLFAKSWDFHRHPIDVIEGELRKQLKILKSNALATRPSAKTDEEDITTKVEGVLEFLKNAKPHTNKMLQVTQLVSGRLESPIELKTDKGERYLLFIDVGEHEKRWSAEEMRISYHGESVAQTE